MKWRVFPESCATVQDPAQTGEREAQTPERDAGPCSEAQDDALAVEVVECWRRIVLFVEILQKALEQGLVACISLLVSRLAHHFMVKMCIEDSAVQILPTEHREERPVALVFLAVILVGVRVVVVRSVELSGSVAEPVHQFEVLISMPEEFLPHATFGEVEVAACQQA